jgi:hypothetical protein
MRGWLLPTMVAAVLETPASTGVDVKVTQKYLVAVCLDGAPVNDDRHWRLASSEHGLAFTMKNEPRHPAADAGSPGFAFIRFTPEEGHRYEIEVRAPATSFSTRVWNRGEWKPVVRDRTTDEIVSGEPEWRDRACR